MAIASSKWLLPSLFCAQQVIALFWSCLIMLEWTNSLTLHSISGKASIVDSKDIRSWQVCPENLQPVQQQLQPPGTHDYGFCSQLGLGWLQGRNQFLLPSPLSPCLLPRRWWPLRPGHRADDGCSVAVMNVKHLEIQIHPNHCSAAGLIIGFQMCQV